jgi:hypothetical protein
MEVLSGVLRIQFHIYIGAYLNITETEYIYFILFVFHFEIHQAD